VGPASGGFKLAGAHDVNATWVRAVRASGARVVPRIAFEAWTSDDWSALVNDLGLAERFARAVARGVGDECAEGIVLDVGILPISNVMTMIRRLVHAVREGLAEGAVLALTVPPPRRAHPGQPAPFAERELLALADSVDYFSVMSYDFAHAGAPGPNAPLAWVRDCLNTIIPKSGEAARERRLARKVLLGLNFYGNDYVLPAGGGPIVGAQFLDLLRTRRPKLVWERELGEHSFTYSRGAESHRVFYPTLASIRARIDLARHYGVGLSIWEIGQGLPYFFDAL
jgi:chitinase domain-containing protein 1